MMSVGELVMVVMVAEAVMSVGGVVVMVDSPVGADSVMMNVIPPSPGHATR